MNAWQVILAFLLVAGSPSTAFPRENPCRARSVPVEVLTSEGVATNGLAPASLQAFYRGKRLRILSVTPDTRPRRLVLLVDASGSMATARYERRWPTVVDFARQLVERLPAQTSIGLGLFAEHIEQSAPVTADRATILAKLAQLGTPGKNFPHGHTALWDALAAAMPAFGPLEAGDAIYVITDGEDTASQTRPKNVKKNLMRSGLRLFALLAWWPLEAQGARALNGLVLETGGVSGAFMSGPAAPFGSSPFCRIALGAPPISYIPRGADQEPILKLSPGMNTRFIRPIDCPVQVPQQIALQAAMIALYQRVEVELPEALSKAAKWKLELVPSPRWKALHAELIYPRELPPCTAGSATTAAAP